MGNRRKGVALLLTLLLASCHLTGCSVEEFLAEVVNPILEENKELLGVKAEINV